MINFLKIIGCLFAALIFSIGLYLIIPFSTSSYSDANFTETAPIQVDEALKCQKPTLYVKERLYLAESETIDLRCYHLQQNLLYAIRDGKIENIKKLISEGANINKQAFNNAEIEPVKLMPAAVITGRPEIVSFLLDNGGDVNDYRACCMDRKSLLMLAVNRNDIATTRLLLSRRADLNFKGYEDYDVFKIALEQNNPEIIKMLNDVQCITAEGRIKFRANQLLSAITKIL